VAAAARARAARRAPAVETRFGPQYVRRFYLDPRTRVVTPREMRARVVLIAALLEHAGIRVRRILDAGCGIGLMRAPFAAVLPRARYVGLDASEYLCRRYGWVRGSVVDYAPRVPADLVICYDVLQYLDAPQAARAIRNLSVLTRAALYVSALTSADWRTHCDRTRTDRAVHLRSGAWYRERLEKRFRYLGVGVWLRKDIEPTLWEMEGPTG
jgi:SAM-dependent methyltransferase